MLFWKPAKLFPVFFQKKCFFLCFSVHREGKSAYIPYYII
jgi:hypothetical protein